MSLRQAFRARPELGALSAEAPGPIRIGGRAPGVVAFHGFGGTTREIEIATSVAAELGLSAVARTLPGHGSHARELARTRFADWLAGARDAYQELAGQGRVIAAGLSMGSLLAAELAIEHPETVCGLVLLANAVWLRPSLSRALRAAAWLHLPDFLMRKGSSDIADLDARQSHLSYSADPVHAAIDLERSGRALSERLAQVRCPTLILHGAHDHVCPVENAWRAANLLGTRDVRVVILPRSQHVITRDVERADVARELRDFYARIAAQTPVEP
ncbi:MAG TPA: alpha/beta fold hydrolase [Polyangiaceae bacterium]|nr:alpha/beta fold hydrolase [Polyangiaceae bacterium]